MVCHSGPTEVFAYQHWESSVSLGTHQLRLHRTGLPVFRPLFILVSVDKLLTIFILSAGTKEKAAK